MQAPLPPLDLPALQALAAPNPQQLSDASEQAFNELLREGQSQNTLASYRAALRYWAAWFYLRFGSPLTLPLPCTAVMQFVVDHAQRSKADGLVHELPAAVDQALVQASIKARTGPLALNTIVHRVAVLSKAHEARGVDNPCHDPTVKALLSHARRAYAKRGVFPRKKDALTSLPMDALLATCDDSLRGLRDRALLAFAFSSGGRRRSEVADADMAFLSATADGEYTYYLAHSKTNQAGTDRPENHKPVVGVAAAALRAWLAAAEITSGRIFRSIRRGGTFGESLSADAVANIVRARCVQAGLVGDFSAHSLRSGFVTAASEQGASLADTMALTGHRSAQTVLNYTRSATPRQRVIAKSLLEPRREE